MADGLLHDSLSALDHEEVWILYLTVNHTLIGMEMISKGTLDTTAIDCRTVLRQALLHNAGSIILLHNHPSGVCTPSVTDIKMTNSLHQACLLMDIPLVDHIIITEKSHYSFADNGRLSEK